MNAVASFCSYIEGTLGGCTGMLGFSALLALPLIVLGVVSRRSSAPSDFVALQRLSAIGVDLSAARPVEFMFFFRTEPSASHIASVLGQGYSTRIESGAVGPAASGSKPVNHEQGYLLHAETRMVLSATELTKLRTHFSQLASAENGMYLGWNTNTTLVEQ
jgi:Regulator of ribonuclease activity B